MFLALKEMKKEKRRYTLIIGIITLISYLIFFLLGLAYGLAKDNISAVEKWQAKSIVLSKGTNANLSSSVIDEKMVSNLNPDDYTLINLNRAVTVSKNTDKTINLVLFGMDTQSKAFPEIIEGTLPKNNNEIIASSALKREHGFTIGDQITLTNSNKSYTITGFTDPVKYNVSSVIYTTRQAAQSVFVRDGFASGIILYNDDVFSSFPDGYERLSINDFIMALPGYLPQLLTFSLMIGFLVLIGSTILSVFMYILTMQKLNVFAILKIQGVSNQVLSKSLLFQTFVIAATGVLLGVIFTLLTTLILPKTMPFQLNILFCASISFIMIMMTLLGAIFSMRSIKSIDPLVILD